MFCIKIKSIEQLKVFTHMCKEMKDAIGKSPMDELHEHYACDILNRHIFISNYDNIPEKWIGEIRKFVC
jgi:hypothetical protein